MDWEYPGYALTRLLAQFTDVNSGNGEDYKRISNIDKQWEIEAYPKLLSEIRHALGPEKLISAAVPGLARDMIAFNNETMSQISVSLDFFNVMAYDLMNRRDDVTKHHTGIELSMEAVKNYLEKGIPSEKLNLGFAYYVKWFQTSPDGGCDIDPVGCKTVLMEDPVTGADLGCSGAFAWDDDVPPELAASFERALAGGRYDSRGGGHYFWDSDEDIWWTWDTPEAIQRKFPAIVEKKNLGGVFAWGLGEDGADWRHLKALTAEMKRYSSVMKEDDGNMKQPTKNSQSKGSARMLDQHRKEDL